MKIGDCVKTKSGSPVMVIEKIENETVHCVWFAGLQVKRAEFQKSTLELSK